MSLLLHFGGNVIVNPVQLLFGFFFILSEFMNVPDLLGLSFLFIYLYRSFG